MYGNYPGRAMRPAVPASFPMLTNDDVLYALLADPRGRDPTFVDKVLTSYIHTKASRGRRPVDIALKLEILERQVPEFAAGFRRARETHHLGVSRVLGRGDSNEHRRTQSTVWMPGAGPSGRTRPASISHLDQSSLFVGAPLGRASTHSPAGASSRIPAGMQARPAVVRRESDGTDEPPPPAYALVDPEPEATAALPQVLAAQGAGGGASSPGSRRSGSFVSVEVPRPSGGTDAASLNDGGRVTYDPPAVPPPAHLVAGGGGRVGGGGGSDRPNTPESREERQGESNEEDQRAQEESELAEAMRQSTQAERERQEYDAAMTASLAQAEAEELRRALAASAQESAASEAAGQSWIPHRAPESTHGRRQTSHQPASASNVPAGGHRRHNSQTHGSNHTSFRMADPLAPPGPIPGAYGEEPAPSGEPDALTDAFDSIELSAPSMPAPLQPQRTADVARPQPQRKPSLPHSSFAPQQNQPQPQQPPALLRPQSTGMQSNNPFLTESERQHLRTQGDKAGTDGPAATGPSRVAAVPDKPLPPPPSPGDKGNEWEEEEGPTPTKTPPRRSASSAATPPPLPPRTLPPGSSPRPITLQQDTASSAPNSPRSTRSNGHIAAGPAALSSSPLAPSPLAQSPLMRPSAAPSSPGELHTQRTSSYDAKYPPVESLSFPTAEPNPAPPGAYTSPTDQTAPPPLPTRPPTLFPVPSVGGNGHAAGDTTPPPVPPLPARPSLAVPPVPLIGGENALEMLREYHTVFLIDDSTSMQGARWELTRRAIQDVIPQAVAYADDGIDVHFLNSKRVGKGMRTAEDVEKLFSGLEPHGATPTGLRMEGILRDYMARLETADEGGIRSMNLIVVTDGAPTDDPESVLIATARRLDRGDYPLSQVGVQLLQIGDDVEELDDGLAAAHGVRDMVDTVPYKGEEMSAGLIVKVLLGGINRRFDRRG